MPTVADRADLPEIVGALEETGAWVLAAYGPRLVRLSIFLDGYAADAGAPLSEAWGLGFQLERGVDADCRPEDRTTLRGSAVRFAAERVLVRLLPGLFLTHAPRDIVEIGRVAVDPVSAHHAIPLLKRHGSLASVLAEADAEAGTEAGEA